MRLTKSILSAVAALALATGAAFANGGYWTSYDTSEPSSESMPMSSLETTDEAYFAQGELVSEPTMTDSMTLANTGTIEEYDVYYIYPVEVVEVQEIWLVPSVDSEMPQG